MNFTVIDEENFNLLISKVDEMLDELKRLGDENLLLKTRYLTAREAGQITGYGEKTIKNKKDEIGYITKGKELKFLVADINAWMMADYIKPRIRGR